MDTQFRLVDAFNLLHASKLLNYHRPFKDIASMLYVIEHHAASLSEYCHIVFDGTRFEGQYQDSDILTIHYSDPDQTADEVLERLMTKIPGPSRRESTLVSNDNSLCDMARGAGLRAESSSAYLVQLCEFVTGDKKNYSLYDKKPKRPFNNPFTEL